MKHAHGCDGDIPGSPGCICSYTEEPTMEAMPAPPTELVYRDPAGGFAKHPPTGKLDGWEVRHIPSGTWAEYQEACRTAADATRTAAEANNHRDALREELEQEWGSG